MLDELYRTFGFYQSRLLSFSFEGSAGFAQMSALITSLRAHAPHSIGGLAVEEIADYQRSLRVSSSGAETPILLPKSNVLRFFLVGGNEAVVRPSGTEPKLKMYLTATAATKQASLDLLDALERDLSGVVRSDRWNK